MPVPGSAFPSPVALHEAAHLVVARAFDPTLPIIAALHPPECYFANYHFSQVQKCAAAAAGAIATAYAAVLTGAQPTARQVTEQISEGDWHACRENPQAPSAAFLDGTELAWHVLLEHWQEVIDIAEILDARGVAITEAAFSLLVTGGETVPEGVTIH